MKPLYYFMVTFLVFTSACVSAENQTIIAGFGGEFDEGNLQQFRESGLTADFHCIRPAPQMTFSQDADGRWHGVMPADKRESYINKARLAEKYGIDLYLVVAYFSEYVTQLKETLGPYTRAYVQGPTRYISPGEKDAPGPLEERYWLGQLLAEAKFVAELSKTSPSIKGFLIDVEMYAGDLMWRGNSSFDDQTYAAVTTQMQQKKLWNHSLDPAKVDRDKRYAWLYENNLIKHYFAIQEQLVSDVAREFRREIDAINPDLAIGMLPYEVNWFYNAWLKGLANDNTPVMIISESEYGPGITPSVPAIRDYLDTLDINYRYMPGFYFYKHSPQQLAFHAGQALDSCNGFWMFTTYSIWQPDPSKLHTAYLIQAPAAQYWDALRKANVENDRSQPPDKRFSCPGYTLLTGNSHYAGPKADLPLKVSYSREPDVLFFDDPQKDKLFDGGEHESVFAAAWHAKTGEEVSAVIDLSRPVTIEQLRLSGGHILSYYPSVVSGGIDILTSMDGEIYYHIAFETLYEGRGKNVPEMVYDRLGIKARYVKVLFKAKHANKNDVWTLSELAVWGTP